MAGIERSGSEERQEGADASFDASDDACAEACGPKEGSRPSASCSGGWDEKSCAEDSSDVAPASRGARVRKAAFAWLRHPLRSTRNALDVCSVRSAFFFYALIGMAAAFVLSLGAVSLLNAASEEILYGDRSVYPGLYIYDEELNALVSAEKISWYEGFDDYSREESESHALSSRAQDDGADSSSAVVRDGASLYIAERSYDSPYYSVISLDNVPDGAKDAEVRDIDEAEYREGEETRISLQDVPAYDETANARRGDAQSMRDSLPVDENGKRPAVSLVCYYVYVPTGILYQVINLAVFVSVPLIFAICFLAASRGFYKRKLQRPIQAMDAAARRIAEGDLSVPVSAPPEGSRSELDRLCVSFEDMRSALERNNKAMWRVAENRRKVNAAFAHDLRTPLTVLKGRAEMLSTFAPEGRVDAAGLAEASAAMSRQTERLQRYVESMKDLADLDECTVEPHAGDVGAWFVRAAAEASDLVRASGIDFEAKAGGLPRSAAFDDVALSRIVENALSNALRFAESKVSLSCAWKDGLLTVRVADDGPGFDAAALEHGCEPFWRDSAEKRRDDSAHFGLGLNICAELCEKHGGGVRLMNAESGGAVVGASIRAPLA